MQAIYYMKLRLLIELKVHFAGLFSVHKSSDREAPAANKYINTVNISTSLTC
jgi:hypothetical protein